MYATDINALSQTYRVLSVDLPGHGASSGFDYYDMALFEDALLATVSYYNFTDFLVCGHSMGGLLAIDIISN